MTRLVHFMKPGVEFGQSMLTLHGCVELTGEQHEDFPEPLPLREIQARIVDGDRVVASFDSWKPVSYFLNGSDQSRINAASANDFIELDWGCR